MPETELTNAERVTRIRALADRLESPSTQHDVLEALVREVLELSEQVDGKRERPRHRPVQNID